MVETPENLTYPPAAERSMPKVDLVALAQRMERAIANALDEMDKAARKRGVVGGEQSAIAIEFRGCLSAMKAWAAQPGKK